MPRKRNEKTVELTLKATWELFAKKGYSQTSYADVARVSGVNRATVQHYFPKKELMASMNLQLLRTACAELVSERWPDVKDPIAEQFLMGQIYVSTLLRSPETRRFTLDVLESRAFTNETIASDLDWSLDRIFGAGHGDADTELKQDVLAAIDGLYGLMYHSALTGEPFNLSKRLRPGLLCLGKLAGRSADSCEEAFDRYTLTEAELEQLASAAQARAFSLIAEHPWVDAEQ